MASFGDLNSFVGIGRLTRDPELRYTPSGTAVCRFGLAINRTYKSKEGDNVEDPLFINITVWGKQAEFSSQYLKKGRRIAVNGELRSNNWVDRDGNKRISFEINARTVQLLDYLRDIESSTEDEYSNVGTFKDSSTDEEIAEEDNYIDEKGDEEDIPF
ncbi:MAG: single-stranded DNA-binding protein [Candidatus Atribacteria bacterium]|jgi:single-strand DNA-binding protein|nr:single-stranded DNA-binding protein [Candidatus Atribacteria bacterium]